MQLNSEICEQQGHIAVVLGAHINGLGVIRSLGKAGLPVIAVDRQNMMGQYSRYCTQRLVWEERGQEDFTAHMVELGIRLRRKAVLFITDDRYFRYCTAAAAVLQEYFYLPFNEQMGEASIDKAFQYEICRDNQISCPVTNIVSDLNELNGLLGQCDDLQYPLIIKPGDQSQASSSVLGRLLQVDGPEELLGLASGLEGNLNLIVSEVIPGEPETLWAYNAYCHRPGEVMAGWTAQKISQRPYRHGSFTIMRAVRHPEVAQLGKTVLRALEIEGPAEVEFKWDERIKRFQYIETNPRHIQYNHLGLLVGVDLVLVHYYSAVGDEGRARQWAGQQRPEEAYMVLAGQELANILELPGAVRRGGRLLQLAFSPRRIWAIHDCKDWGPSLQYLRHLLNKAWKRQ